MRPKSTEKTLIDLYRLKKYDYFEERHILKNGQTILMQQDDTIIALTKNVTLFWCGTKFHVYIRNMNNLLSGYTISFWDATIQ